ncbi:hypothetical protein BJX62DRAFT_244286 [Aspergillus germanicus]
MRTVARRQDLAAQVMRIWIHPQLWESHRVKNEVRLWKNPRNPAWRFGRWFYRSEIRDVLGDVADALGTDAVQTLSEHDLIAVFISMLPNLQYRSLQLGVDDDDVSPAAGLRATTGSGLISLISSTITSLSLAGQITPELPRIEQNLRGLAEAVSSRDQLPNLKAIQWDETETLSEEFSFDTMPVLSAVGVDFIYTVCPLGMSTLGESKSTAHPSYFDDGSRYDPRRFISPSDLPPVPQPALDETDPDLWSWGYLNGLLSLELVLPL